MSIPDGLIYVLGFAVWLGVIYVGIRQRRDLDTMALLLIVTGILGTGLLEQLGIGSPDGWAFMVVGIVILSLMALGIPRDHSH